MIDFDFSSEKACADWFREEKRKHDFYNLLLQEDASTIYHSEFRGVDDAFSYWCDPVSGFSVKCDFLLVIIGNRDGLLIAVDVIKGGYEYRLICKRNDGLPVVLKDAGYEVGKVHNEEEIKTILSLIK